MKKIIYITAVLSLLLNACEKGEDFNYQLPGLQAGDVDSILLTANHDMMVAGSKNDLTLQLYLYTRIEKPDTILYYPLLNSRADSKAIRYFYTTSGGQETEIGSPVFNGAEIPEGELTFYAKVFGKKSNELKVNVRQPIPSASYPEKDIQVIFHIVEYGGLLVTDYKITPGFVMQKLQKANIAFRQMASIAPNAVDSKINFRAARENVNGNLLENPGWDSYTISQSLIETTATTGKPFDINTFITKNKLNWDNSKYLNIWIVRTQKSVPSPAPLYLTQATPGLEGLSLQIVQPPFSFQPTDCGIVIEYNQFIKEDLAYFLGQYLGLLPTAYKKNNIPATDTDYCNDTFMYSTNDENYEFKTDPKRNIGYLSDNIMDKKSTSTTISMDQLKRMLLILEYSPVRQSWTLSK